MLDAVRLHLRSGVAWWVAVVTAIGYAYVLLAEGARWLGDTALGVQLLGYPLSFALVALAMLTAWDSGSPAAGVARDYELVPSRPPGTRNGLRLLVVLVPLLVVHVAGVATVLALSASSAGVLRLPWEPVALQMAAIGFAAVLGFASAHHLPRRYAVPFAGIGIVLVFFMAGNTYAVYPQGDHQYAGLDFNSQVYGPAILTLMLAALLLALTRLRARESWPQAPTFLPAIGAGVVVLATILVVNEPSATQPSGLTPDLCDQGSPMVCVYPEYRRLLPELSEGFEHLVGSAERAGLPREVFPRSVRQGGSWGPPRRGVGVFHMQRHEFSGDVTTETIAAALVRPEWCDFLRGELPPPESFYEASEEAEAWLLWRAGEVPKRAFARRAPRLAALTSERQADEVAEILVRFRDCRTD